MFILKILKTIKENYFIVVITFVLLIAIFHSCFTLYYKIKYWNVEYNGKIVNLKYQYNEVDSEKGKTYIYYTISVDSNHYVAKTTKSEKYKIGDNVIIILSKGNAAEILVVNGNRVANKIGRDEIFSFIILFLIIIVIIFKIRSREKL